LNNYGGWVVHEELLVVNKEALAKLEKELKELE
jgi:hypothetical protein